MSAPRTWPAVDPDGSYPAGAAARDRFVLDLRGPRPRHDAWRHQGIIVEDERTADGRIARAATVFLTGRECPWRCVMCDLWQYTIAEDTPRGAIPAQVRAARGELRGAAHADHAAQALQRWQLLRSPRRPRSRLRRRRRRARRAGAGGRRIASGARWPAGRPVSGGAESPLHHGGTATGCNSRSRWGWRPCTPRPSSA